MSIHDKNSPLLPVVQDEGPAPVCRFEPVPPSPPMGNLSPAGRSFIAHWLIQKCAARCPRCGELLFFAGPYSLCANLKDGTAICTLCDSDRRLRKPVRALPDWKEKP